MNEIKLKQKLYCVLDTLSGALHHFTVQTSDSLAVRSVLLSLTCPLRDNKIYCLCDVDSDLSSSSELDISCINFGAITPRLVSWDSYKLPETRAEAIAPLGLSPDEVSQITRDKINSIENMR